MRTEAGTSDKLKSGVACRGCNPSSLPPTLLRKVQQEGLNLLPDIKNTPLGSTARQVTASRWATMECTDLPGGRDREWLAVPSH